jgi:hypothetical protein
MDTARNFAEMLDRMAGETYSSPNCTDSKWLDPSQDGDIKTFHILPEAD